MDKNNGKQYILIAADSEAVSYVLMLTGFPISAELYRALPNRLKKSFTDVTPLESNVVDETKSLSEEDSNANKDNEQDQSTQESSN